MIDDLALVFLHAGQNPVGLVESCGRALLVPELVPLLLHKAADVSLLDLAQLDFLQADHL